VRATHRAPATPAAEVEPDLAPPGEHEPADRAGVLARSLVPQQRQHETQTAPCGAATVRPPGPSPVPTGRRPGRRRAAWWPAGTRSTTGWANVRRRPDSTTTWRDFRAAAALGHRSRVRAGAANSPLRSISTTRASLTASRTLRGRHPHPVGRVEPRPPERTEQVGVGGPAAGRLAQPPRPASTGRGATATAEVPFAGPSGWRTYRRQCHRRLDGFLRKVPTATSLPFLAECQTWICWSSRRSNVRQATTTATARQAEGVVDHPRGKHPGGTRVGRRPADRVQLIDDQDREPTRIEGVEDDGRRLRQPAHVGAVL